MYFLERKMEKGWLLFYIDCKSVGAVDSEKPRTGPHLNRKYISTHSHTKTFSTWHSHYFVILNPWLIDFFVIKKFLSFVWLILPCFYFVSWNILVKQKNLDKFQGQRECSNEFWLLYFYFKLIMIFLFFFLKNLSF